MDKKKNLRRLEQDDLKGFEEFLEELENPVITSKSQAREVGPEAISFLQYDHERLKKVANLLSEKIPNITKFSQAEKIVFHQKNLNLQLREELFAHLGQVDSPLHRSLSEIFNGHFKQNEEKKD